MNEKEEVEYNSSKIDMNIIEKEISSSKLQVTTKPKINYIK